MGLTGYRLDGYWSQLSYRSRGERMTISFEGKVAIVTGSGAGLGRAHALELARRSRVNVIFEGNIR